MLLSDIVFETKTAILANKARSGLTILGIVIGIASVIAMIAIGNGAQSAVENQIQSIGSNLLTIRPGSQRGPGSPVNQGFGSAESLSTDDVEDIESVDSVENVAAVSSGRYQIIANGNNTNTSVEGSSANYPNVTNIKIDSGSFFSESQVEKKSKVAVMGPETVTSLFGEDADVYGKKIRIGGIDFSVIGTTQAKGGTGFGSSDDIIYIPITTFQQYLQGDDSLSNIYVSVASQDQMDAAQEEIETLLLENHGISDPDEADFRIMNQADIIEMASSVTGTFTILLGAVAGISLIVGGIGIMNMMLTSVTERTREIGLRKAIGAQKEDISKQFLFESVVLTFIGGIIGIVLGCSAAIVMNNIFDISAIIAPYSIVLAFGVSALIGVTFGYYPARRAAKLNPIEALRYE